jgi:hypothetical protein
MHTMQVHADPDEEPTRFLHNPDLSGKVVIVLPASAVSTVPGDPDTVQVSVPGRNVEAFVLEVARDRLVGQLEEMPLAALRDLLLRFR